MTGAGKGIGRAIAIALATAGAETYALSRTQEDLESLEKTAPQIHTVLADISQWESTRGALRNLLKDGAIDLLVNNAGIGIKQCLGDITEEAALKQVQVNLLGTVNVTQQVSRAMKERGNGGAIVNISALSSRVVSLPGIAMIAATKAGIDAMMRVAALELGPHNIRINSVLPTYTKNDKTKRALAVPENKPFWESLLGKMPLGKLAEIQDVVNATLFLLSKEAGMITGTQLCVDGGLAAC